MQLALYQPDIPPNTGTIIRMAACLNIKINIIEPCGFPFGDKSFRRAGMDYINQSMIARHQSWDHFLADIGSSRLILLSTKAHEAYTDIAYHEDDILLLGRESAGVPYDVHHTAHKQVIIPMTANARSLNVAISAAMVLGEAMRQTDLFPPRAGV